MFRRTFFTAVASLGISLLAPGSAKADDVIKIKIGTLAPKKSAWGTVFDIWARGLKERTGGKMELEFYPDGQQGDEIEMVKKLRNGQLDGAAMTATGLSQFSTSFLALQLPGWSNGDWGKVDGARKALKPILDQEFAAQKMVLAGSGDVGLGRILSIGQPVKTPADLKALGPFSLPKDPISKAVAAKLGGNGDEIAVPEILGKLGGRIKVISTPALAAESLGWSGKFTHMNSMVVSPAVGGLVLTESKLASLPPELKTALLETADTAGKALTGRIRKEDEKAFKNISGKVEVFNPTPEQVAEWQKFFGQVRAEVCGTVIKKEACELAK